MQSADRQNDNQPAANDHPEPGRQEIFEQIFNQLMNGFGEQCEKMQLQCAIAIAKHPDFDEPLVFYNAPHIVEAASLMAQVLRQIKKDILSDLDIDKGDD